MRNVQVFQVRKKNSGRIYAMKVMRKDRILARDHGEYVRAERDVLTAVHHPYVVTLRYSFQARFSRLANAEASNRCSAVSQTLTIDPA